MTGSVGESLTTLPQLASLPATSTAELTIRWDSSVAPSTDPALTTAAGALRVISSRTAVDAETMERAPQLSEDHLVVVALDGAGRDVGWQLVKDPGIVRAEGPGPSGVLTGQVLRRPVTSIVTTVPRGAGIANLRIYKPRWTGAAFVLDLVGGVSVPTDAR